jgi:hypothetical protein
MKASLFRCFLGWIIALLCLPCAVFGAAPVITVQPTNQTVIVGGTAVFSVSATGTPPLTYQWILQGTNLPGKTQSSLVLTNVQPADAGTYAVIVTSHGQSTTSSNAVLAVLLPCTPAPSGLVSWWQAESNALDSVGANNGNLFSDVSFVAGEVNSAFDLGTSGYMLVPASASLNVGTNNGFTLEGWVYPTNVSASYHPIYEWSSGGNIGVHFHMDVPTPAGGGPGSLFANIRDATLNDHYFATAPNIVATNTWQHVALTYSRASGVAIIYLNGSEVARKTLGSFTPWTSGDLILGYRTATSPHYHFPGRLDEMSLYNRDLSAAEIQAVYAAGSNGKCSGSTPSFCTSAPSGLVSWWPAEGNGNDNADRNVVTLTNVTFGTGEVGQAFVFNGTNAYARVPASASLNVGTGNGFTIETWVNPAALDRRPLFEWNQTTNGWTGMGVHWWISYNSSGDLYADLLDSTGADHLMATTNGVMATNIFQHIALTYDKSSGLAAIYRNGVVVLSTNLGIFTPQTGFDLYLGRRPWATGPYGNQYFNGKLDETALYNRALTAEEIAAIYNARTYGKCALFPVILVQPTNLTVLAGQTASFSVSVSGGTPLTYQWRCNGTNLPAGTNVIFSLTNAQSANAGTYSVCVTNAYGSTTSSNALLTVFPSTPTVLTQPVGQKVWLGYPATFSVMVTGAPPISFQWQCSGTNLPGATNISLTLTNVQFSQAGDYAVRVTNVYGSALSSSAYLAVRTPGTVLVFNQGGLLAAMAASPTVTFDCNGVIGLTNTIAITNTTTIDGTGHTITLSGGNAVRLFTVNAGKTASFINVTLANGYSVGATSQPGMGGAINNNGGTVALMGCTVVSNAAVGGAGTSAPGGEGLGGAIYNLAGNLSVTNCRFAANRASGGTGGADAQTAGGGDARGGAICSPGGNLVIQNSIFVSHTAGGGASGMYPFGTPVGSGLGGAIWASNATANCFNSTFAFNSAAGADIPYGSGYQSGSGEGGALFTTNGVVNCFSCTFASNGVVSGHKVKSGSVGYARGGAIWSHAALSVSQSSFVANQALGNGTGNYGNGGGGAIFNDNILVLTASTFANNYVQGGYGGTINTYPVSGGRGEGGAIFNQGTLVATNCTLATNSSIGGYAGLNNTGFPTMVPGGDGVGGGLFNCNGTATLVNLTFVANNGYGGGGADSGGIPVGSALGGAIVNTNGTVNLYNTILAYSTSGSNCWGTVLDYGHNLSSDNSAGFYMPGSLNNTDPVLGALADYGGPTLTVPLLPGSPAIDGGSTAAAPPTDQRGHARPYGAAADIGAFELSPPYIVQGILSGPMWAGSVTIQAGSTNITLTSWGTYRFQTLAAGSYVITPSNPACVFVPNVRSCTIGPDVLNADFRAYVSNNVSIDSISGGNLNLVFAGANGHTYRTLTASNLAGPWLPAATNVLTASNYFEVTLPMTAEPRRFYRTVTP